MTQATRDLEASTFQKRPAYRYIRTADRIPTIGDIDNVSDPMAMVKLFNPTGAGTWYIAAYDQETRTCYGVADIQEKEAGCFSMAELVPFRGRFGLPIERDLSWTPRPMSQV